MEESILPIDRAQDNRDDPNSLGLVPFHGQRHFAFIAKLRGHEVRANKQQDNLSFLYVGGYLVCPLFPCINLAIMPEYDMSLSLQVTQVLLELVPQCLVFMCIGIEDFNAFYRLCCQRHSFVPQRVGISTCER